MSNYKKGIWCEKWNELYRKFILDHEDKLPDYPYKRLVKLYKSKQKSNK